MIGARRGQSRRASARRVLAAVVVASGLLAAGSLPAAAQAHPLVTGISGLTTYDPLALQQVNAAGIDIVRIPVAWASVAPQTEPNGWNPADPADPNYDWSSVDSEVKATMEGGLTPVIVVEGAPAWAQGCHLHWQGVDRLCEPQPAALAAFATAAATRYSGSFEGLPRVRYWQALNEPNLSLFFDPQYKGGKVVSAALYRKLINAFYFAVKSVDPADVVIAGGLGPIAVRRLTVGPMLFTRLLLCMQGRTKPRPTAGNCEGGVHFDVFDIHPYTTGGPSHQGRPDDVQLGDLGKLQELLHAADRAGRIKGSGPTGLWIMEFSWDSNPPDPGGLAMKLDSRWTAEALYRAWRAGVSDFFWFSLMDFPREGRPAYETFESGLYFRGATLAENEPKELMYAFRFPFVAYRHRNGVFFWGRTPASRSGQVAIQVFQGHRWQTVARSQADANGIFSGTARTSYGIGERGKVRALDSSAAATYATYSAPPASVAFSLHPVKDFHQPPFGAEHLGTSSRPSR